MKRTLPFLFFLLLTLTAKAVDPYYKGNGSGLTNLNPANLTALYMVSQTAVFTNNSIPGFSGAPCIGLGILHAGVSYFYAIGANDQTDNVILSDTNENQLNVTSGGIYTPSTNTPAFLVDVNGNFDGEVSDSQVSTNQLDITLPANVNVNYLNAASGSFSGNFQAASGNITGSLVLGTPLGVPYGGTGQTSLGRLASQVGTKYLGSDSVNYWTYIATNAAAYTGQLLTANFFGGNNPVELFAATGTGNGQMTNPISPLYGLAEIGNPSFQVPGLTHVYWYLGGNPIDQTNAAADFEINILDTSMTNSGGFITFGWVGNNASLGTQTWPGWPSTKITNALGQFNYLHDSHAMGLGMVPDAALAADLPSTGLWVMNEAAGQANSPAWVIASAASPVGSGNYSWLYGDVPDCIVGAPVWVANKFTPQTSGWIWGWSYCPTNGAFTIASNLNVNTLTVTNTLTIGQFGYITNSSGALLLGGLNGSVSIPGTLTVGSIANTGNFVNPLIIGNATNTATGTLIQTNFVSGKLYTNIYGRPILASANATLTTTGVSGNASLSLLASGYLTNQFGMSTIVTSIAMSYTNVISMVVPASQTYTFTNTSTGAGDSASVLGGQILVY